jgi:hypothetical protein
VPLMEVAPAHLIGRKRASFVAHRSMICHRSFSVLIWVRRAGRSSAAKRELGLTP